MELLLQGSRSLLPLHCQRVPASGLAGPGEAEPEA